MNVTKSKGRSPNQRASAPRKRNTQLPAAYSGLHREDLLNRISIDPTICFGKPCIKGHRIWVSLILDFLASGEKVEQILGRYPQLSDEDIRACVAYGAELAKGRFLDIPSEERA
jgi:uncharacterized protein (DUF433 family)